MGSSALSSWIPLRLSFHATVILTTTSTDDDQFLVSKGFLYADPFTLPGVGMILWTQPWIPSQNHREVAALVLDALNRDPSAISQHRKRDALVGALSHEVQDVVEEGWTSLCRNAPGRRVARDNGDDMEDIVSPGDFPGDSPTEMGIKGKSNISQIHQIDGCEVVFSRLQSIHHPLQRRCKKQPRTIVNMMQPERQGDVLGWPRLPIRASP